MSAPHRAPTRPIGPTVAFDAAERVVERARSLGVPVRGAADVFGGPRPGASPNAVAVEARVRYEQLAEVWHAIGQRAGHLAPSLSVASETRLEDMHVFGFAALTAESVAAILEHLPRLGLLVSDAGRWRVHARGADTAVEWERTGPAVPGHELSTESSVAHLARSVRQLGGEAARAIAVSFAHAAPPASIRDAHARFFGCAVTWSAAANAVIFDSATLLAAPRLSNAPLHAYLLSQAEALAGSVASAGPSASGQVARVLTATLARGDEGALRGLKLGPVARRLGCSERTLRRRLADEGTSFRELLDDVRRARAEALLADHRHSLTSIAFALGFADQAALTRACVRWFSAPPSRLRGERAELR